MIYLNAQSLGANEYTSDIFGANVLSSRDQIGENGTYDEKVEALGVEHIRYPGGSLTEDYFDLRNPDKATDIDPDTGKQVELIPYSDFMAYAEENDIDVTVVLPTRNYLSQTTDENGHRTEAIDDAVLRGFIRDTLNGEYGEPTVRAFEIGNEYWGSGEMSALEYGRVSSRMAEIIQDEISKHPEADVYEDIDILVQNGQNYGSSRLSEEYEDLGDGAAQLAQINEDYNLNLSEDDYIYNSGQVAWPKVMNEIIISEFDKASEIEAVDGLALHIYSKGAEKTGSRDFDLRTVEQLWDERFGELDKYITEWNLKASRNWDIEENYGLKQAHELLNMTEEFTEHGVDVAHVWAIQQNNLTNLAGNEGDEGALNVPGEMFRMMSETLTGTRPVFLENGASEEHEVQDEDVNVHTFYGKDQFVTFLASTTDETVQNSIDFSGIVDDPGNVRIEILGVAEGDNPTSHESEATVTRIDAASVLENGVLTIELEPYEIARVVMENPDYDPDFQSMVKSQLVSVDQYASPRPEDPDDITLEDLIPSIAPPDEPSPEPDEPLSNESQHDTEPDDNILGGLGSLAGFLPLLALMGGF